MGNVNITRTQEGYFVYGNDRKVGDTQKVEE
jgi:hypothetical protein